MACFVKPLGAGIPLGSQELASLTRDVPVEQISEKHKVITLDDRVWSLDHLTTFGFTGTIWTNSRVYYAFDSTVSSANKQAFLDACIEWSDVTNVIFIERTDEANYIHVQSDPSTNSSSVGMQTGKQIMKIASWSNKLIICHEIGHALGLEHEHARIDRDTFVKINEGNIESGKEHNFDIENTTVFTRYDFLSIMHYSEFAFSTSPSAKTIEVKSEYSEFSGRLGNRSYLTSRDAAGMYFRYGYP